MYVGVLHALLAAPAGAARGKRTRWGGGVTRYNLFWYPLWNSLLHPVVFCWSPPPPRTLPRVTALIDCFVPHGTQQAVTLVSYRPMYTYDGLKNEYRFSSPRSAAAAAVSSVRRYLRHHNPDPSAPNGVRPAAVQTFVKSTAGYCVITYLVRGTRRAGPIAGLLLLIGWLTDRSHLAPRSVFF